MAERRGGRREKGERYVEAPPREELRLLYLDERLSAEDLSRRYDQSMASIYSWLREYDIPLRGDPSKEEVFPGLWRRIVGVTEVPYDTDPRTGRPVTYSADVLECGHLHRHFLVKGRKAPADTSKNRRCWACEKGKPADLDPATILGCCDACNGLGSTSEGPCWDCLGTGHTHPTTEDCTP